MSKLAKVDRFFKNVNLTSDDEVFVGVDVHKKSYHVALCLNDTPAIDFRMNAEPKQLNKTLGAMAGSINKAANGRLRNNLIQAAWVWVKIDIEAKKCFWRICDNCGGIKQKAIVAMARKMSGHLWAMLMNDQPYDKNKAKCRDNNER